MASRKTKQQLSTLAMLLSLTQLIIPTGISLSDDSSSSLETQGLFNRTVLDQLLVTAEESDFKVIKVRKDGSGDFLTVTDAVKSVPRGNARRVIICIGGGEYWEKLTVDQTKKFVTFYGDPNNMPTIVFNGTAADYNGTVFSATVAVESDYFVAVNIAFVNSAPMPDGKKVDAQAVAMRISGDKAAFYNCKFIGFQDTLCDDRGRHYFKDCYIRGTFDFIWGNGKSFYLDTTIHSVAEGLGMVTAQARESISDESGFMFVNCNVKGTGNTYLGRAYKASARVVFAYTYMDNLINTQGWSNDGHPEYDQTVYYGEHKCMGPGSSFSGRVKFAKILSEKEAKPFLSVDYIQGSQWILPLPPSCELHA